MNEHIVFKYENGSSDGFDLGLLGESFSGMNSVMKDICALTGVQGDITLKATRIEHGSVEIFNAIHFTYTTLPFNSPLDLMDFLRIASPELLRHAQAYFSEIGHAHQNVNQYFEEYPFDNNVMSGLVTAFIIGAWHWAGKLKNNPTNRDQSLGEITPRQAARLRSIVVSGKYKRALKPITEGNVSALKVSAAETNVAAPVVITERNVGDYLPDDARILPEFENGSIHNLTGEVVALQNTRGDVLKLRIDGIDPSNSLLTAHPDDGASTEDFKDFYKQRVTCTVEIVRLTMYKRPELVIKEMAISQQQLV